ncbi:MAG: hypothetical protein EOO11_03035, partial [Chitinophagaceae bacterium]
MRKLFALLATLVSFSGIEADAQNVSTNGGSGLAATYPDLASAVTALNAATISSPVVITLNANETAPAGGYVVTAQGSAANPITIHGGGASRSTVISANAALTAGALNDAIIKLRGADYVTIQNLSLQENGNVVSTPASNTSTEWGIALLYASATDGAQNNTIQDNNISMNRGYANSFGIYSNTRHTDAAIGTAADASSAAGANSDNKVYRNAISNVNLPIAFIGSSTAAAQDLHNEIGGTGNGNSLTNWGGAAAASTFIGNTSNIYGIYLNHQQGSTVQANTLTSAALSGGSTTVRGIQQEFATTSPTGVTFTNTISNNTITLNSTGSGAVTGILNQTLSALATATVHISSNTLTANTVASAFTAILNSQSAGTLNMNSNIIRGTVINGTSNSFTGISSTGTIQSAVNINNNKLGDASGGAVNFAGSTSGTVTGINCTGATAATAFNIKNNDFRGFTYTTSGTGSHTYINLTGATAANAVATVDGNTFTNLNVNTTGSVTFMSSSYLVASTGTQTISNNSIAGSFNKAGAGGTITLHTSSSSSTSGASINHTGNNFSNITVTGATTIAGWISTDGGTANKNYTNNTFSNWTGGTSAVTGMSVSFGGGAGGNGNVLSGNVLSNFSGGAAVTGISIGTSGTAHSVIGNTIFNLSSTGAATVTGITSGAPTTGNIAGNKIYGLSNSNASGSVVGIAVTGGTTHHIYNNLIGGLTAPGTTAATGVPNQVIGINITAGSASNISYNTIYLTGSGGASFGSSGVMYNTTPTAVTLRNNIIINKTTPTGTGLAVALRRNNGTAAAGAGNYGSTSNNNLFYAGTPGASNLLYSEYNSSTFAITNSYQTLAAYKTFMATRDQKSVSQDVTFQSTTGASADFLKFSTSVPTPIEGGGVPVAGVTTDFGGATRSASQPDIGAWELTGIGVAPSVSGLSVSPNTASCSGVEHTVTITATPNPNGAASFSSVMLYYSYGSVSQTPVAMTNGGSGNVYTGTIPATNALVSYYVVATDENGFTATSATGSYQDNPLRGFTPVLTASPASLCAGSSATITISGSPAFEEGFESASFPLSGWATAGTSVTADQNTALFAEGSSSIRLNTTAGNNNATLSRTGNLDLSSYVNATLTFSHIAALEDPTTLFDTAYVEYSTDGGNSWITFPASSYAGSGTLMGTGVGFSSRSYPDWMSSFTATTSVPTNAHWKNETIHLPASALTSQFRLRFRYATDPNTFYYGWLIDNVKIAGARNFASYTWNDGTVTNSTTRTITPSATTTYSVTGTDANGCTTGSSADLTVTVNPLPATPTATPSTQCGTHIPEASVIGSGGTFRWYSAATDGTLLQTGGSTYATAISQTTTFYVAEWNGTCESARVPVTVTVTTPDAITAAVNVANSCPNTAISLSATQSGSTNSYSSYEWTASPVAGSGVATLVSGNPASVTPTTAGTYVYTVTATDAGAGCATTSTVSVTVAPPPSILSASGPAAVCSGAPAALVATTADIAPGSLTFGTQTSTSITGGPYRAGFSGEMKVQYFFSAAELTAAGLHAGPITSLSFHVTSVANAALPGFTIKMGHTSATGVNGSFDVSPLTQVLDPISYTTVVGVNTHTFNTPFVWDGTSNIIVQVCHGDANGSTSGTMSLATATNSIVYATSATACAGATTGTTNSTRPVMTFGGEVMSQGPGNYTWTWTPGGLSGASVTATAPINTTGAPVTQVYTVTAVDPVSTCSSTSTVSVSVNPAPVAPTGTHSTQCGFGIPAASVAGAGGTFKWYSDATAGTLLQTGGSTYATAISETTTFYVSESNGSCGSVRTPVSATVTAPDAVAAAASAAAICEGASTTLSATQTGSVNNYTFTWTASPATGSGLTNGTSGQSVPVTPTTVGTYTYTVTATDAGAGCTAVSAVTLTVNPNPVITTATATTVCSEGNIALSATYVPVAAGTTTIGAGATSVSSYNAPFYSLYSNKHMQVMIKASELAAANVAPGPITALNFPATTVDGTDLNLNFSVKLAQTSAADMSTFVTTGLTQVYSTATFTQAVGNNRIELSSPYTWDGTSNLVIDICFYNPSNTNTLSSTAPADNTSYVSVIKTHVTSSASASTICGDVATNSTTYSVRPKILVEGQVSSNQTADYSWTWMPGNIAGATASATAPVNNTGTPMLVAFTVRATDAATSCFSEATANATVNPVALAPVATNSAQCGTSVPTASVAGSGGTFKWYSAATGGSLLQTGGSTYAGAVSSSTTFYVSETNSYGCETARTPVTVTVSTPDPVSAASNLNNVCPGTALSLTATRNGSNNNYSYSWTAAPAAGSGIPSGTRTGNPVSVT